MSFKLISPICSAGSIILALALAFDSVPVGGQAAQVENLATLTPGRTKAVNALWTENPLDVQFKSTNRVVVANLQGPAEITMMHFAYGRAQLGKDPKIPLRNQVGNGMPLTRDLVLRIYWDGETNPSVECPLVDFFCDPDGAADVINTAFVNVRRGLNEYFPMPFRKSARVELDYEGAEPPGAKLQLMMPCYSYVCYRTLKKVTKNEGYFHASWRQDNLLLGQRDYTALEATGRGKFVGWNVTVYPTNGCSVDANEKFYIDGETNASVEFQGLEDSVGFSWGFPSNSNFFPFTGYVHFENGGGDAYRFFVPDAISFEKSLKVAIGFGPKERGFQRLFSRAGSEVRLSSTAYWYQTEPHEPFVPLPPPDERAFSVTKTPPAEIANATASAARSNHWEPAIRAYEATDRTNPPPSGAVVFTGASNIRLWTNLAQAFPGHKVFNRGFGGAEMSDLVDFAGRVVIPYRPKVVIIYAGDNDLAAGKSPERIITDFTAFVREVHAALSQTVIGCIAVKPSPSRARLVAKVEATDALLKEFCRTNDNTVYLDDLTPMLSATGGPRPELFGKDGLHLNENGRAVWISIIQPVLDRYDPPGLQQR